MSVVATQTQNTRRLKLLVTITAGTPIIVIKSQDPVICDRVVIQMLIGGTGYGLVYNDVPVVDPGGVQPAPANISTVCGPPEQLAPASANSPGGSYTDDPAGDPYVSIDARTLAVDGSHTGDTALVDLHLKI